MGATTRYAKRLVLLRRLPFFPHTVSSPVKVPWHFKFPLNSYSTDEGAAVGAWVVVQTKQQEGVNGSEWGLTPNFRNAVFDIACLNEQSRNNDGHEGSSDGVLSDYPTVYCGILLHGKDTWNSPEGPCRLFREPI